VKHFAVDKIVGDLANQDNAPGLRRMVVVDSRYPGQTVEVPLDSHTLVTGGNAVGKTSLIQLVPLFWGASPNDISKRKDGKEFFGYYVPRQTSFIGFEYVHADGGARSVIMHRDANRERLNFRFVRSGLFEDMFQTEAKSYVVASDLGPHLRLQGYEVSNLVHNLKDYRGIIQGEAPSASQPKKTQEFRSLTKDFCVGNRLGGIERVISAMLSKDGSLLQLSRMITDDILRDKRTISFGIDRSSLATWPDRFRSYKEVMSFEKDARSLSQSSVDLNETRREISEVIGAAESLIVRERKIETAAKLRREQVQARSEEQEARFTEDTGTLKADRRAAESTADREEARCAALDTKRKAFFSKDVEEKAAAAERAPEIEENIKSLDARLEAATSESQHFIARYARLESDRRSQSAADGGQVQARIDDTHAVEAERIHALESRKEQLLNDDRRHHETEIAAREIAAREVDRDFARIEERQRNPSVSDELLLAKEKAEADLKDARDMRDAQSRDERRESDAQRQANDKLVSIEARYDKLERNLADQTSKREQIKRSMTPEKGTLLEFLRREKPGWGDTIGRVVSADLLQTKGLNPRLIDEDSSIFGLAMDIAQLPVMVEADLSEQEAALDAVCNRIEDLEDQKNTCKAEIHSAVKARESAYHSYDNAKAALDRAQRKLVQAESRLDDCKSRITREKQGLEEKIAAELAEKQDELRLANTAVSEAKRAMSDSQKGIASHETTIIQAAKIEFKQARKDLMAEKLRINKQADEDVKGIQDELNDKLSGAGVSKQALDKLEKQRSIEVSLLDEIRKNKLLLNDWHNFQTVEWVYRDEHQQAASNARMQERDINQQLSTLQNKHQETLRVLTRELKRERTLLNACYVEITTANSILAKRGHHASICGADDARTANELLVEFSALLKQDREVFGKIRMDVSKIAKAFQRYYDSPAAQFFENIKSSIGDKEYGPDWVAPILEWFSGAHEQHKDSLMMEARTAGAAVSQEINRMKAIHRNAHEFNRKLQASLRDNMTFSAVSDLKVEVSSSVTELRCYPLLEAVADGHAKWIAGGANDVGDFQVAIEALLDLFPSGVAMEVDLSNCIDVTGQVRENENLRKFNSQTDLSKVSSNGMSYLILVTIFVGFLNMKRKNGLPEIVWALDELSNIDTPNTGKLLSMLTENNIRLIAATPQSDILVRQQFDYLLKVTRSRVFNVPKPGLRKIGLDWSSESEAFPEHTLTAD
jgi:hypothetical protein